MQHDGSSVEQQAELRLLRGRVSALETERDKLNSMVTSLQQLPDATGKDASSTPTTQDSEMQRLERRLTAAAKERADLACRLERDVSTKDKELLEEQRRVSDLADALSKEKRKTQDLQQELSELLGTDTHDTPEQVYTLDDSTGQLVLEHEMSVPPVGQPFDARIEAAVPAQLKRPEAVFQAAPLKSFTTSSPMKQDSSHFLTSRPAPMGLTHAAAWSDTVHSTQGLTVADSPTAGAIPADRTTEAATAEEGHPRAFGEWSMSSVQWQDDERDSTVTHDREAADSSKPLRTPAFGGFQLESPSGWQQPRKKRSLTGFGAGAQAAPARGKFVAPMISTSCAADRYPAKRSNSVGPPPSILPKSRSRSPSQHSGSQSNSQRFSASQGTSRRSSEASQFEDLAPYAHASE